MHYLQTDTPPTVKNTRRWGLQNERSIEPVERSRKQFDLLASQRESTASPNSVKWLICDVTSQIHNKNPPQTGKDMLGDTINKPLCDSKTDIQFQAKNKNKNPFLRITFLKTRAREQKQEFSFIFFLCQMSNFRTTAECWTIRHSRTKTRESFFSQHPRVAVHCLWQTKLFSSRLLEDHL